MPVAPNSLLQAAPAAKPQAPAANAQVTAADPRDKGPGFAQVFANQGTKAPVKADDTIAVTLTVKQITPRTNADYGEVRWDALVTNQDDEPVATYDVLTLVAKEA